MAWGWGGGGKCEVVKKLSLCGLDERWEGGGEGGGQQREGREEGGVVVGLGELNELVN